MKKPPPIFAFVTKREEDRFPLEGAVLATEVVGVLPADANGSRGHEGGSLLVLKNGLYLACVEDHETVIRRWVETLIAYEAEEIVGWGVEGR